MTAHKQKSSSKAYSQCATKNNLHTNGCALLFLSKHFKLQFLPRQLVRLQLVLTLKIINSQFISVENPVTNTVTVDFEGNLNPEIQYIEIDNSTGEIQTTGFV